MTPEHFTGCAVSDESYVLDLHAWLAFFEGRTPALRAIVDHAKLFTARLTLHHLADHFLLDGWVPEQAGRKAVELIDFVVDRCEVIDTHLEILRDRSIVFYGLEEGRVAFATAQLRDATLVTLDGPKICFLRPPSYLPDDIARPDSGSTGLKAFP